jgi:hypothetical protein
MAESMIGSLFGLSPEMYGEQQRVSALNEGVALANLNPAARGAALTYAGAKGLGGAIAGAMGVQDPQLKLISARQQILGQLDQTDPESLLKGAQTLAQMGDNQGAFALSDYARKAQSEIAQAKARMAQATRERQQAVPNDIQIANEIATLEDTLGQLENVEANPERTRAKNMLNTRLAELRRLTAKGEKAVAANIKEIGVAEGSREPVYLDVNNDLQFVYKKDETGKQVRVPFTGGVDRTTAKTSLGVKLPEGESEFVKELGKLDAKKIADASILRDSAISTINSLNKLASLPDSDLISGQFATGRVGATSLLQTLGLVSPSDSNKLATSEQYQKVASDVVLQTLGGKLGAGFSNDDRKFIQGLIPQLETSPAARRQLISFMQAKNQSIVEETIRQETYARDKKGLSGFVPKIPLSIAPSQPRPYSGLSEAELDARIEAAKKKAKNKE